MEFGYLKIFQLTLLINHGSTRINEFRKQVRFSKILLESWYAAGMGAKIGAVYLKIYEAWQREFKF